MAYTEICHWCRVLIASRVTKVCRVDASKQQQIQGHELCNESGFVASTEETDACDQADKMA